MSFINQRVCWLIFFTGLFALPLWAQESGFGVAPIIKQEGSCLSEAERTRIWGILKDKLAAYPVSESTENDDVLFELPVRQSDNYNDPGFMAISVYVDHQDDFPDRLLDWNCEERTYDTQNGYNHQGTDYFPWPFWWRKMDQDGVEIVAAAAGTIIFKEGGRDDKSCEFNSNPWNAVYIRHDDGSVAWYGHLKTNSLTSKGEGDRVAVGEFLGIMGSSGNSTGPHLHFEVYDSGGNIIDPYRGNCNPTTSRSWWKEQEDYWVPGVNKLMTHDAPPVFGCYDNESVNQQVNFTAGQTAYFATYFRDQLTTLSSDHQLITPEGMVYREWNTTTNEDFSASYWYRSFVVPSGTPGKWTFRVTYQDDVFEEYFYVVPASGAQVEFSLSTDEVLIENVPLGERKQGSLTLTNTGNTGLIIEGIEYPDQFSGGWTGLIHAGESKGLKVTFQPETEGEVTGQMTLKTNVGDYQVDLRGTTACNDYEGAINAALCEGAAFSFGNNLLTEPGEYTETFQNQFGCDSTVFLTLSQVAIDLTVASEDGVLAVAEASGNIGYQWYNCGSNSLIAGATSRTYRPLEVGQYQVVVTKEGCEETSDCVMVDVVLGVEHNEISDQLQVYPNPTQGKVTVDFGDVSVNGSYQLLDNTGLRVNSGELTNQKLLELQLNLPAGLYFLQITDQQGRRSVINLIKQ